MVLPGAPPVKAIVICAGEATCADLGLSCGGRLDLTSISDYLFHLSGVLEARCIWTSITNYFVDIRSLDHFVFKKRPGLQGSLISSDPIIIRKSRDVGNATLADGSVWHMPIYIYIYV